MWVGKLDPGAQPPRVDVRIKCQQLKQVTEFRYVGSTETEKASMNKEAQIRLQRLATAFSKMWKTVFGTAELRMTAKLCTYRTAVLPNGIYASTAWNTMQSHIDKLDGW